MSAEDAGQAESDDSPNRQQPQWLLLYGGAAWRILAIGTVVYFALVVLERVSVVILGAVLALFPASVLWRPTNWMEERRIPRGLAAATSLLVTLAALVGIGALVMPRLVASFGDLAADIGEAGETVREWLIDGPLSLTGQQIDDAWQSALDQLQANGALTEGLLGGASALLEVGTSIVLMLFTAFFLLKDGRWLFHAVVDRLDPERGRPLARAISTGWSALAKYMAGLAMVGLFDAVFIGIGLWIIGVPFVVPLAVVTFFGAFLPLIGAWSAGFVAVAVALVNNGFTDAAIVFVMITVVQQLEGDVVMPIVFGQTLQLHPLVVLLAVVGGGAAFGILGAFLAVPIVAVAVTVRLELADDPSATFTALATGRRRRPDR